MRSFEGWIMILHSKFIVLVTLCSCLLYSCGNPSIQEEPSPISVIEYLTNKPVTMLDWGIFRLEQDLKNIIPKLQYNDKNERILSELPSLNVYYDSNSNSLTINIIQEDKFEARKEAEQWSDFAIREIKHKLGIDSKTGTRTYPGLDMILNLVFEEHKSDPKKLTDLIEKMYGSRPKKDFKNSSELYEYVKNLCEHNHSNLCDYFGPMSEPFANELDKLTKISILGFISEGDNIFSCESPLLSTKNTFFMPQ